MKHVRVRITAHGRADEIHPMYGVIAETSFVKRATAIQWNYTGDALGILHYIVGDLNQLEMAMQEIPEVVGYDMERIDNRSCYVYVRDATTDSLQEMFSPITSSGLIVVPPIQYEPDRTVVFSVFGPDDEIQTAIECFSDLVDVTIEKVGSLTSTAATIDATFTNRQREVAETAIQLGYYDIPRSACQEDIAAELDCAPSTIAEHLRKVEAQILRAQFG